MQCLAQDPERAGIWIGYESQGLFFFDPSPDRVGPLGPLGGLPAGRVNAVFGLTRWVLRRRFRRRLEREKAVHQERSRIARDIHDDLGAGLTHLAMVARIAERDVTQQAPPEVLAGHLQEVFTEAGAMVRSVDEIVWAVTPANDQLAALADYIVQYAQHFLRAAGIGCRVDLPEWIPPLPVRAAVRHHLYMVVREALNNVVKHARASPVQLSIGIHDAVLGIGVADDGVGFDPVAAAVEQLPELRSDVVLLDINLPGISGSECIGQLSPRMEGTRFLVLTVYQDSDTIFTALDPDATYTLDLIDCGDGGWGWVNLDSVGIPVTAVASPYAAWAAGKGLAGADAAFDVDPDGDTIPNGIEFVIGGEPNPAHPGWTSLALLPTAEVQGERMVFAFTRAKVAAYLGPMVEFSEDLVAPWTVAADPGNATIEVIDNGATETVTVTIPRHGAPRLFVRLRVTEP